MFFDQAESSSAWKLMAWTTPSIKFTLSGNSNFCLSSSGTGRFWSWSLGTNICFAPLDGDDHIVECSRWAASALSSPTRTRSS
jgi:hypothetical protein